MAAEHGTYGYGDMAAKLGVGEATIRKAIKTGEVPKPMTICGSVRWSREIVDKWLAEGGQPTKAKPTR